MNIVSAEFRGSFPSYKDCPRGTLPEFAFIGRSNVGKSSLINMLTGRKSLALTSATPGKTVQINYFLVNGSWHIVDLPGYGFARMGKAGRRTLSQMIQQYVAQRKQLTNLFVLIDSRIPPQQIDLDFIEWLGENGVPFSIVLTKADKPRSPKVKQAQARLAARLAQHWDPLPPMFVTSSAQACGRDALLNYIDQVLNSLHDVPTPPKS